MDLLRPTFFFGGGGRFLGLISPQITLTKKRKGEKERTKRKKRRRREKGNGNTLSFHNGGYFADSFWPKKDCWTQKVHLAVTFSKIRLDICMGS